jgi:hypothetical protein
MASARPRQFWRHVRGRKNIIENWLEMEVGLTALGTNTNGQTELSGVVEPTWTVNPRNGQQSFAASVGLLIGIPQR